MVSNLDNKSILTLLKKAINWLYQVAYFTKHNKSSDEAVKEWLEIENEKKINDKIQIEDNSIGWLCYNVYDNK